MIEFVKGDMFAYPADIRVNTVNTVGVMGAGVALAFKQRYPEMYKDYQQACRDGRLKPGKLHIWKSLAGDWIVNFPTKRDWRDLSTYEDIERGLDELHQYLRDKGTVSVALPAIGCGHGGLDWSIVSRLISEKLAGLEAHIYVFEPSASHAAGRRAKSQPSQDELEIINRLGFEAIELEGQQQADSTTSESLYIKGHPAALEEEWIAIIPSKSPSMRERRALEAIAAQMGGLPEPITIALVHSTTATEEIAHDFLQAGTNVILILPFGILTRKRIARTASNGKRGKLTLVSTAAPSEKWTRSTFARSMELMRKRSKIAVVSDEEPAWLAAKNSAKWRNYPLFYVRYDGLDASSRKALQSVGALPIGRKADSGSPNLSGLWAAAGFEAAHHGADYRPVGVTREHFPATDSEVTTYNIRLSFQELTATYFFKILQELERMGATNVTLELDVAEQPCVKTLEEALHRLATESRMHAPTMEFSKRDGSGITSDS